MLVVTAYGLSAPTRREERTPVDPFGGPGFDWTLLLLVIGAFVGTVLAWIILVERRRPWPFGERRADRPESAWAILPFPTAWLITELITSSWGQASGLYPIGQGDRWLDVTAPVDLSRTLVLFGLCSSVAYAASTLIGVVIRRRRVPPASPGLARRAN